MMHRFPTRAAALRSLKDISTDAIQHANNLITEIDGMFCFDEDTAEQYFNTLTDNLENTMSDINVKTATTKQLVEFYNDHAESTITKFRDRATAEKRCQAILDAIAAEEPATKPEPMIGKMTLAETVAFAKSVNGKKPSEILGANPTKVILDEDKPYGYKSHGLTHCPACGIHLDNGVGLHMEEVNGKYIKHNKFEYACLGCGAEFGPAIPGKKAKSEGGRARSETQAQTMKTSMKLPRTIEAFDDHFEFIGRWNNAFHMWKSNPSWMTSAQQDRLTATLYKAAKEGKLIVVEINGRQFHLKNI